GGDLPGRGTGAREAEEEDCRRRDEQEVEPGARRERRPQAVATLRRLARGDAEVVAGSALEGRRRAQAERRRAGDGEALERPAPQTVEHEVDERDREPEKNGAVQVRPQRDATTGPPPPA